MSIDEFKQLITAIVLSIGGTGVVIGAIFVWLGRIWADRLYLKTSAYYQEELEKIREIAVERRDLTNSLLSVISNQRSKSYERILDSVEFVWEKVLEIRNYTSALVFIHVLFMPSQVENLSNKSFETIPDTSEKELLSTIDKVVSEVEKQRPFIGEKLWELFFIYDAFLGRLALKTIEGKVHRKFFPWNKTISGESDRDLFDMLKPVFSEEEIKILTNSPVPVETIRKVFEIKILEEMNQITLGSKFVERTIDEYIRFAEISTTRTKGK